MMLRARMARREFIRAGLAGGALLAVAGWLNAAGPRARDTAYVLDDVEREMLSAIVPVLLAGAMPGEGAARREAVARTVDGVVRAVSGLSLASRKEVGELFGLLAWAPGRRALAGVGRPWREAEAGEIARFLASWRSSRFGLLFSGYAALHDLILGAWYARPEAWEAIGYPGPPEVFR